MRFLLNYTVKLGKYDGNDDVFEYEVENTDAEIERVVKKAIMTGTYYEDVPELQVVCNQAYHEIERQQIEKLKEEADDAFALECFANSKSPFDCGYAISVFFPDDAEEIIPEDDEIEAYLRDALSTGDVELAEEVVLEQYSNYSGNLFEKAFELAAETGCQAFIDKNKSN